MSWKSYQEGLPSTGANGVNVSDGYYTLGGVNSEGANVTSDFAALSTSGNPVSSSNVVYLYAVKYNPFAYFASVQEGASREGQATPSPTSWKVAAAPYQVTIEASHSHHAPVGLVTR